MKTTAIVMSATVKNTLRLWAITVVVVGVVLICVVGLLALLGFEAIRPEMESPSPDQAVLENYLGLALYTTSFISVGIFASVFAFQSMLREKSRGNIQALLATPLEPGHIWVGKSLGVFLPGLVFAVIMTLGALLAVNFTFLVPEPGFLVTGWMVVSSFVAVPLVYLALTLLVHLVALVGKPVTGNVIAMVFLQVALILMINLVVHGVLNAASWLFTVILLAVAVAIATVALALRSRLTPETIVLSQ
jgi:ABC-type transport system involved in multi-copper enzyme maturation permease subunit